MGVLSGKDFVGSSCLFTSGEKLSLSPENKRENNCITEFDCCMAIQ